MKTSVNSDPDKQSYVQSKNQSPFQYPSHSSHNLNTLSSQQSNKRSIFGRLLLATSLVCTLGMGMPVHQAQASSLAELFGSSGTASAHQKFLKVEEAFSVKSAQNGRTIEVTLNITPKHYLYKDKLKLTLPEGVTASAFKFSHSSESIDDPTFGKVEVFRQPKVTATAVLTNASGKAIDEEIKLIWQGCADAGLCYPPQSELLTVSLPTSAVEKTASNNTANSSRFGSVATANSGQSSQNKQSVTAQNKAATAATTDEPSTSRAAAANKAEANADADKSKQAKVAVYGTDATVQKDSKTGQAADSATEAGDAQDIDNTGDAGALADEQAKNAATEMDDLAATEQAQELAQQSAPSQGASQNSIFDSADIVNQDPFGLAEHPWLALLLLFLAGLGLAFTPCVLPMLPIVSNIVARQHTPTAKKGLMLSGSYALGVAVAYGILGAVIAIFGQQLGIIGWLQNPVILLSFAAVFVLLALYMLDVIRIPVPSSLRQKTHALSQAGDKYLGSSAGSFIAGLLSALVVSPCVSAPLFGALLAVSTIGNPLLGFAALFMLGFGLSAPLILLGIGQSNLMPKAGEWMNWVKQGFALLLFAVALLLVERVLFSPIMLMLWSVWFMVVATWAWRWQGRGQLFVKPMAIILAMWSTLTMVGAAAGSEDSWQPLRIFTQPSAQSMQPPQPDQSGQLVTANNPSAVSPLSSEIEAAGLSKAELAQAEGNIASSRRAEGASDLHLVTLESLIPVIENNDKVLVDLTAEWCVECRLMDKSLFTNRPAALQQWQMVRLDVTETNADSARILSELRLFGPPALLYFVNGKLVEQQVGVIKRDEFEATLARL